MPKDNVYPGSRDVDAYMATAPNAAQPMLRELRQLIRGAAPAAKEKLSYGMPFYEHHGHSRLFRGLRDPPRSYDAAHVDSPVVDEAKAYLDNRSPLFLLPHRSPLASRPYLEGDSSTGQRTRSQLQLGPARTRTEGLVLGRNESETKGPVR